MFCVGKVGEEPRLYMQTPDEQEAYDQAQEGEVCFQVPDSPQIPPIQRYKIVEKDGEYSLAPKTDPIEVMRDWFWSEAKKWRETVINTGMQTTFGPVDTNMVSQIRISTMATAAQADEAFTVDWTMEDNSVKTLTAGDLISLNVQVSNFLAGTQSAGNDIRSQIDAADSQKELEAIDIFAGYPSESLTIKEKNNG